ncbi:MAG: DMT family transporter [Lewinellaceae bacterium]|nr:DMT family transporter [Lewinellaceae bacterium]
MLYLILSILCSVLLGFIFKLFQRFGVDSFQAIVFNYFTCVACGWIQIGRFPTAGSDFESPWMPYALALGFIFIAGFNGAAATVRYFGVTVSQVMQKMSILMTVPFAILAYGESSGWGKIAGFVLALAAIIFVNVPSGKESAKNGAGRGGLWWIPLVTWILSGVLEVLFVIVQKESYTAVGDPVFISTIFGTAGLLGLLTASAGWVSGRLLFSWRNVAGGILLGIPNYGSMLFLLMALGNGLEGSFVFPVVNVGIILVTTIGAVGLFHEHLSKVNWLGIVLALTAITLISL